MFVCSTSVISLDFYSFVLLFVVWLKISFGLLMCSCFFSFSVLSWVFSSKLKEISADKMSTSSSLYRITVSFTRTHLRVKIRLKRLNKFNYLQMKIDMACWGHPGACISSSGHSVSTSFFQPQE